MNLPEFQAPITPLPPVSLEAVGMSPLRKVAIATLTTLGLIGGGATAVGVDEALRTTAITSYDCRDRDPAPIKGGPGDIPQPAAAGTVCPDREGLVTFVYIPGLEPAGYAPVTTEQINEASQIAFADLSSATDTKVRLRARTIVAPGSVTDQIRANMKTDQGEPCVDIDGRYTPSGVVSREMADQLRSSRLIVAIGGKSCEITYFEKGVKKVDRAAGVAPGFGANRKVDIYSAYMGTDPEVVDWLALDFLHEIGHKYNLGHTSDIICGPDEYGAFNTSVRPVNLDAVFELMLTDRKHCTFDEYSSKVQSRRNLMGRNFPLPNGMAVNAGTKDLFISLQADFMSGRAPSSPGSRTALLDRSSTVQMVTRLDCGPNEPYGVVVPLDKPMRYSSDPQYIGEQYTNVVFDYASYGRKHGVSHSNVDVYLSTGTNAANGSVLKMIYVGTLSVIPSRVLTIGNKTIKFENAEQHTLTATLTNNTPK